LTTEVIGVASLDHDREAAVQRNIRSLRPDDDDDVVVVDLMPTQVNRDSADPKVGVTALPRSGNARSGLAISSHPVDVVVVPDDQDRIRPVPMRCSEE
jgi:hypothetical protein